MRLESRQTREARWAVEDAELIWADHQAMCVFCDLARLNLQPRKRCTEGKALYAAKAEASRRLKNESNEDKKPSAGQMTLF